VRSELSSGQVHKEYVAHASYLDQSLLGISPPATGPFGQRLAEFGQVQGLIFGHYGECSAAVHDLIRRTARQIALKTGLQEGARSIDDATAANKRRLYKKPSILSHCERAGLVLAGLQFVGNGSAAAGIERDIHYRRCRFEARGAAYREYAAAGPSADFSKSRGRGGSRDLSGARLLHRTSSPYSHFS